MQVAFINDTAGLIDKDKIIEWRISFTNIGQKSLFIDTDDLTVLQISALHFLKNDLLHHEVKVFGYKNLTKEEQELIDAFFCTAKYMDEKRSSKVMKNIFTKIGLTKEERLMRAARYGNLEKTKKLLKRDCDPNSKTRGGHTALIEAAMNGHLDVAKTLLDAGANPNLHENTEEMTPLHFAANRNYPEVIKILIEYGADTEAKEKDGLYTPLFFAVFSGHTEAVKILLDGGAGPDPKGYEREELVQMSLFLGYDEITSMLLTAGTTEDIDIQPRILIVDDDRSIVSVCRDYFRKQGYETYTAFCSEEALELLSKKSIDVVITDVNRPSMSGLELTTIIKEKYDTEVIISTGYPEGCSHEKARKIGAFELFYKPVRLAELLNSVKKALEKRLPT